MKTEMSFAEFVRALDPDFKLQPHMEAILKVLDQKPDGRILLTSYRG